MRIFQANSPEDIEQARTLFKEYQAGLGISLCFQNFDDELKNLPGDYAPPDGRLLIATDEGALAGCLALRKVDEGVCEMKRLFVRDEFRGKQIGIRLIERLITDAREIGYKKMLLDTYPPKMGKAVKLYESHGFREIPPYYDNPYDGVLYLELEL